MLTRKRKVPSVTELVTEFTGRFQEVADENEQILETQAAIISLAETKKVAAEKEKKAAQNFIRNFEKMAE